MSRFFSLTVNNSKTLGEVIDSTNKEYGFGDAKNYFNIFKVPDWSRMDTRLMLLYQLIPLFTLIIITLILIVLVLRILRVYGINSGIRQKAIEAELENFKWLQKRDKKIIRMNKLSLRMQRFVSSVGLNLSNSQKGFLEYNLARAKVKGLAGITNMTPEEYNAVIKVSQLCCALLGLLIAMLFSAPVGFGIMLIGCVLIGKVPIMIIRYDVRKTDEAIKLGFFGLYGEIHYTLLQNSDSSLKRIIRQYAKMDMPEAMKDFANDIADEFELYGDVGGARHIAQKYKEINEVSKLMRLIQQYSEGGEVNSDLIGFRQTLLVQRQLRAEKQSEKVVNTCRRAMIIIYIVLAQVAISTMLNVLPDLLNFKGLLGG